MNNAPSAALFGGTPYCFYSSASSTNQGNAVWYQYYNGSEWVQDELSFSIYCQAGPSAVVFGDQLYVFFEQADPTSSAVITYVVSSNGSTWSGGPSGGNASSVGSATTNESPSAVNLNGVLYAFYTATESTQVCLSTSTDGATWTNFGIVPSTGTSAGGSGTNYMGITGSPAAVAFSNSIYVFHQGQGNSELWYNVMDASGNWQGDTQIPLTIYDTTLSLAASPSAFVFNNQLYVVFDAGGQLYYITPASSTSWNTPVPFGLITIRNAPSVVAFNNQLI